MEGEKWRMAHDVDSSRHTQQTSDTWIEDRSSDRMTQTGGKITTSESSKERIEGDGVRA